MDKDRIINILDECLVKNYLASPDIFEDLEDPFPEWFKKAS